MTFLVPLTLFGWIPVVLLLFALLPPRRAVIVTFIGAWLFLPMAGYKFAGIPDYTKMSATCAGVLLGAVLFDPNRLMLLRPRWVDGPMLLWCASPFFSSVSNDLGPYDGASAVLSQTVTWGLPYVIGRIYFTDLEGLRELAVAIFVGGLIYVPFCLWEIRMSPRLDQIVYGYSGKWGNVHRWGGWRPKVFMQDGLMVGMWMASAALVGIWLWRSGLLKPFRSVPAGWLVTAVVATALLCKSFGAILLLGAGVLLLCSVRWLGSRFALSCALVVAPVYCVLRTNQTLTTDALVVASDRLFASDRTGSLRVRLENEDLLTEKAMQRPLFGWGRWGRNRVYDERGKDISLTDGLWVIVLGQQGVIGLGALLVVLLLPPWLMVRRLPPHLWGDARFAPAAALAVLLVLYTIDCLMNAMVNPVFTMAAGGLAQAACARASYPFPIQRAPYAARLPAAGRIADA